MKIFKTVCLALVAVVFTCSCNSNEKKERQYIDLGLSVNWADVNEEGTSIEEIGDYYLYSDLSSMGEKVIPSVKEAEELIQNTTHEWTTINGIEGYKFTAFNGNSIFLPATGRITFLSDLLRYFTFNLLGSASDTNEGYYLLRRDDKYEDHILWFNKDTISILNEDDFSSWNHFAARRVEGGFNRLFGE
ncbi:MAG: hypothetical protein J6W37_04710 [Bacteroidales bacterium]|nr:hypothetical protein [Bacteroidales bacterium]